MCGNYAKKGMRKCGKMRLCGILRKYAGKCGLHNFPEPWKKYAVKHGNICGNYAENAGKGGKYG